ncbi:protein-L-isoaspartate(D-aspartate) O-methyltransferase [Bathymodiolus platifrons methanotrophic gill symbiont]|uniref:protein-L-isoaspartate(D-aspartate) O-methyltransferase n=1 Tax=Bathymodiolus platifrons methanotrophic gill symbiont TaxID=113268 RepID=UPI000B41B2D7|nr:protein-L-isoaspartate(D-aspartate) O-methyltransferase [Bathymodiolus platifrons methanotrophic gill symbiont]MCK5870484.1 protein-L-isoaspartate(D-aspartate) O-methyltransferase [Methyloprofundus sp.]TXK96509.1 protein-L-isoaspartate O-methyltransferase [Methylococcaceae bacterium CS5]TXK99429.1 protein-L-isoaspartate O-methyltransferase [Methylococcaceae bacterium CS4]TXL03561.1 protein-L-isoaspartate O-methyltransferase [Methylococcaceae bacterium CS3]TXL05366.1 protein-L-isoaspartate O
MNSIQGIGMTSRRTRERMINRLIDQGISNHKILDAMRNVPRHLFMDDALASRSYEDTALPIGHGQTISQPYIVAKMTELLVDQRHLKNVLEIGTGCGYQTAMLAQLIEHVNTVERIYPLYKQAKDRLWELNIRNVSYLHSDGGWGWEQKAPFDGILVAAAPPEIPEKLLEQMAVGGIMLIPIGKERGVQELQRVIRTESGYEVEALELVSFVPFLSGRG